MTNFVTAARTLESARDALVTSGTDVGPFVAVPYTRDRVAAYRTDAGRIRYELVHADGSYVQHTFHSGTQAIVRALEN